MSGQKGAGTVVQSVDKAMVLLEILYREQRPMYLMELSDASAYPKSTTHALLATMCNHGVVRQYRDGRYFLGLKLAQYGQSVSPVWEISREIYPHLMQLAKAGGGSTGEGEGTGSGNGESQGEGGGDTGVGDDGDHSDSPTGGAENCSNTPTNSNQSNNTTCYFSCPFVLLLQPDGERDANDHDAQETPGIVCGDQRGTAEPTHEKVV